MRLAIVLTSVCIVAALILAAVYQNTAPLIAAQKEKQIQQALKRAMPAADNFTTKQLDEKMYQEITADLLKRVAAEEKFI